MTSFKRTQRKYVQKAYRVRNWREYEHGWSPRSRERGLTVLAYNLGNLWPDWCCRRGSASLTSRQQRLVNRRPPGEHARYGSCRQGHLTRPVRRHAADATGAGKYSAWRTSVWSGV